MKIAIASDDQVRVAAHTGRCRGFAIYEIAEGTACRLEYRPNTFTAHALGQCAGGHAHDSAAGHSHSHATLLDALADCQALVTRGAGPRLVTDLAARGIEVWACVVESAEEAARQFADGTLTRLPGGGCCGHH